MHLLVARMSRKHNAMHQSLWALSIGVATVANKMALFVTLVDRIPRFDAHWSHFFAEFDWFVVLTSRLDAYISRYGDFCANDNDNDDDDDTTYFFTPCACVRGNKLELIEHIPRVPWQYHPNWVILPWHTGYGIQASIKEEVWHYAMPLLRVAISNLQISLIFPRIIF